MTLQIDLRILPEFIEPGEPAIPVLESAKALIEQSGRSVEEFELERVNPRRLRETVRFTTEISNAMMDLLETYCEDDDILFEQCLTQLKEI